MSESLSSLYTLVKSTIAIVEASNVNTLEVIQARLFVCLFESGHAIPAAYISLGAIARAAATIGINKTADDSRSSFSVESVRLWWGIIMLDR